MSKQLKVKQADVAELMKALGFKQAHKWDVARLDAKLQIIGEIASDDTELPDAAEATLVDIQEAVENGVEIIIVGPDDEEDAIDAEPEVEVDSADVDQATEEVAPVVEEDTLETTPVVDEKPKKKKKVKSEKPKAVKKSIRSKVLDRYPTGPFVRWLGRLGIEFDGAKTIVRGEGCVLSDVSIKWELKERRENRLPAEVTDEDRNDLQVKYPKVFSGK